MKGGYGTIIYPCCQRLARCRAIGQHWSAAPIPRSSLLLAQTVTLTQPCEPQVGADGCSDAVALGVEVVADFHRVAWLALVVVLVHRRLEQERVTTLGLADSLDAFEHRLGEHGLLAVHERPHLLVDLDLRRLCPPHNVSCFRWPFAAPTLHLK